MATLEQLTAALVKADAAGDTAGAKVLADEIRRMRAPQQAVPKPEQPSLLSRAVSANADFNPVVAAGEGALNVASGLIAGPVAGFAGMGAAALDALSGRSKDEFRAGQTTQDVAQALTYQPRGRGGQNVAAGIAAPFELLAKGANAVGEPVASVAGPAAGAAINTAIQAAPLALVPALRARGAKPAAVSPELKAQQYVAANTGLDWAALPEAFRGQLTEIAKTAGGLEKLDPAALTRQAQLQSLDRPVPATRGQLTRDPVQLRNEGNVSATDAGKPIRDIHQEANAALIENLDILRGQQKSLAASPEQVGQSVQGAARAKLDAQKAEVSRLYKEAKEKGDLQAPASIKPLAKLVIDSVNKEHLGWVRSWLKGREGKGPNATLAELEDLRQTAVADAMDGGTKGYYAGKVIAAIDQATEGVGGNAYKAARAARKKQAMEFEEQGGVARLVENKSRTDRAVALEDTWRKTVLGGSIEDLAAVKRTLLTGGDAATRKAGFQAWRDLRAQTIQHIKDQATQGVSRFSDGSPNVTAASMERAIKSVGPEKLNALFGPGTVAKLNQIMEATRTVKTEPPAGFKGSPTFANILAFLEGNIGKVPVLGDSVTGAVRGVAKLKELGAAGREVRKAQGSPLEDAARASAAQQARGNALGALVDAAPAGGIAQQNKLRKLLDERQY